MFARSIRTLLAAALVTVSAVPTAAFADTGANGGDASTLVREGKNEKAVFPMPAATFKNHVEERIAKGRERVIEHMAKKNVAADKQQVTLAKYDLASAKIISEVDAVGADGTVTKHEAEEVRTVTREVRGHQGKGHKREGAETRKQ